MTYPDIMNIRLDMTFDEFKDVISKIDYYQLLPHGNAFYVRSKKTNTDIMIIVLDNQRLNILEITQWKEFFNCTDEKINFTDFVDVFRNKFLKDYEFTVSERYGALVYSSKDWNIIFDFSLENVMILKAIR